MVMEKNEGNLVVPRRLVQTEATTSLLTVMTRNVFVGADLAPALQATNLAEFTAAFQTGFFQAFGDLGETSFGSNPWLRMQVVAQEIVDTGASIVGLQEATVCTVNGTVVADFSQLIIDQLASVGLTYEKVSQKVGFTFAAPFGGIDAGIEISDVILGRTDKSFQYSNAQSGTYEALVTFETPFGSGSFPRQWVSIDVTTNSNTTMRFVSTHLAPFDSVVRTAQATELVTSPDSPLQTTTDPIVLMGDFNSELNDATANVMDAADIYVQAGFIDVWQASSSDDGPGYTWGHDVNLSDPSIDFSLRIDYVMYRNQNEQTVKLSVKEATVVDTRISEDTRPLWPSDHKGVVAVFEIMTSGETPTPPATDPPATSSAPHVLLVCTWLLVCIFVVSTS